MKKNRKSTRSHTQSTVVRVSQRAVGANRVLMLHVHAGGRCEFWGCGKYLLKHPVTQTIGNFGEVAHIVAFSDAGPRGRVGSRPKDIHGIANLMLLCDTCHKLIDKHVAEYPRTLLENMKREHEKNIYHATGVRQSQKTAIVRLEAPINGAQVSIPLTNVYSAILPRHPLEKPSCHIELNQLAVISSGSHFMVAAAQTIDARIKEFFAPGLPNERIEHISVFGLAPIPLLVLLGYRLGNKIPAEVYHHHHDTDDWTWKTSPKQAMFQHRLVRQGTDFGCVALMVSVSGTVEKASLPSQVDERFFIYEISPLDVKADTNCLKTRENLENFKGTYEEWLRDARRTHYPLEVVHFFPAVPPPVAIVCGRELMPKVDPALRIYDYDKEKDGFTFSLEVNNNGN